MWHGIALVPSRWLKALFYKDSRTFNILYDSPTIENKIKTQSAQHQPPDSLFKLWNVWNIQVNDILYTVHNLANAIFTWTTESATKYRNLVFYAHTGLKYMEIYRSTRVNRSQTKLTTFTPIGFNLVINNISSPNNWESTFLHYIHFSSTLECVTLELDFRYSTWPVIQWG